MSWCCCNSVCRGASAVLERSDFLEKHKPFLWQVFIRFFSVQPSECLGEHSDGFTGTCGDWISSSLATQTKFCRKSALPSAPASSTCPMLQQPCAGGDDTLEALLSIFLGNTGMEIKPQPLSCASRHIRILEELQL